MASREVTTDEKEKYNDRFQEFLIAYDGIGVAVSKAIYDGGVKNLTRDQLKKIYAGEITKWSQLGGPDSDIYVIAREQGSGTLDTFNEVIMGNSKAETPGVKTIAMSSAEVKTAVTGSNKAIGYLGFSYSLARKLYLVTFGSPNPGAKAYIDFLKGPQGQKIAEENGFIPVEYSATSVAVQTNQTSGKENQPSAKKQPGFELTFALAGLLGVSCILHRRKV
jgi:phosphate transport system substrate-binding protein